MTNVGAIPGLAGACMQWVIHQHFSCIGNRKLHSSVLLFPEWNLHSQQGMRQRFTNCARWDPGCEGHKDVKTGGSEWEDARTWCYGGEDMEEKHGYENMSMDKSACEDITSRAWRCVNEDGSKWGCANTRKRMCVYKDGRMWGQDEEARMW